MEEKKLDLNTIIGFTLICSILIWMFYQHKPNIKENDKKIVIEKSFSTTNNSNFSGTIKNTNSKVDLIDKSAMGNFAFSNAVAGFTTLENNSLLLKISNKGGFIVEAKLKKYERFNKNSKKIVELIKNNNSDLNIVLKTNDNKVLNTRDLFFEPTLTHFGNNQILSLKLKAGENEFLEYKYTLGDDYMIDFDIHSQGMLKTLNTSSPLNLEWNLKAIRNEKSISYENRYSEIYFEKQDEKIDYVGQGNSKVENPSKLKFVAFKQHFFSTILLTKTPIDNATLTSENLVVNEDIDTIFTKQFKANLPLAFSKNEINYKMQLYLGPTDYKTLKQYNKNLEKIISLGWGIIGWINRYVFIPLFSFFSSYISYGIAIIVFTIFIKLVMSPITYKSFLSQAKMKVLRPEITELSMKFAKEPMKKQQETMKLYNKAGVNPMAGCIPALIQMPFLMASFQFFPAVFDLRQKSFLWADDLSSFDAIAKLPFKIPFYGSHISLFPILAAIAIFFYMKMTSGDQTMAQPQQEGMPDMSKIMKIMIYISPIMMLIFFNSYGAGLSLYNLISNIITIGIMVVIKNYVVDEKKIHSNIEANKLKTPKKLGKFQQKLQDVMKEAEAQKAAKNKK